MKIESSPILTFLSASGPAFADAQSPVRRADAKAGDGFAALVAGAPPLLNIGLTLAVPVKQAEADGAQRDVGAPDHGGPFADTHSASDVGPPAVDQAETAIVTGLPRDDAGSQTRFDGTAKGDGGARAPIGCSHPTAKDIAATEPETVVPPPSADPGSASGQPWALVSTIAPAAQSVRFATPSAVHASGQPTRDGVSRHGTAPMAVDGEDGRAKGRIARMAASDRRATTRADAASMAVLLGASAQVPLVRSHPVLAQLGSGADVATNAGGGSNPSAAGNVVPDATPGLANRPTEGPGTRQTGSDTFAAASAPKADPRSGTRAAVALAQVDQRKTNAAPTGGVADPTAATHPPSLPFWALPLPLPVASATASVAAGPQQGVLAPVAVRISPIVAGQRVPVTVGDGLASDATFLEPTLRHSPATPVDQPLPMASVDVGPGRPSGVAGEATFAPVSTGGDGSRSAAPPAAPQPAAVAIAALVGVATTHYSVSVRPKENLAASPATEHAAHGGAGAQPLQNVPVAASDSGSATPSVAAVSPAASPAITDATGPHGGLLNRGNSPARVPRAEAGPGSNARSHRKETAPIPVMPSADPLDAAGKARPRHAEPASVDHLPSPGAPSALPKDAAPAGATALSASASVALEIAHQATASFGGEAKHTDGKQIEIALAPEELGHVRITMTGDSGAMTLTIHAERQDTLDLLRRNIDTLAQEFQLLGYANTSFSFGQWSGQSASQKMPEPASYHDTDFTVLPSTLAPPAPRPRAAREQGLDIRL